MWQQSDKSTEMYKVLGRDVRSPKMYQYQKTDEILCTEKQISIRMPMMYQKRIEIVGVIVLCFSIKPTTNPLNYRQYFRNYIKYYMLRGVARLGGLVGKY